ncbi:MAG: polyprenyl synthetase family protein [Acidobacteriota bacterium]|nr:polyprenyl synthetase family protein [Acidobacteriota bacterium]
MSEQLRPQSSAPVPGLAAIHALIGRKLREVELEIEENLSSDFEPIDDAGRYLASSGGKRLRPALVLLTSGLLGYRGPHDVLLGAVFEFIHTATLVHDDIIDDAPVRRGRPSANRVYGSPFTVLLGDYLYIRSMNMALRARKLRLIDILAEATERMIEGEILAQHLRGRAEVTPEQHMAIVERKTAWLFSGCCRAATVLAGGSPQDEHDLAAYGMALGTAFQLVDDLLDLTSDEATIGKPVCSDLREGRLTLPLIELMHRGTPEERAGVARVLDDGAFDRFSFERLLRALNEHGCLARTRRLAEEHAEKARRLVRRFPPGPYRELLLELPDTVLSRHR